MSCVPRGRALLTGFPLWNSPGITLPAPRMAPNPHKLLPSPSLPSCVLCPACSAPRFHPDFRFIPAGDPSPAWTGNRGHGSSVLLLRLAFKMLICILNPSARSFFFKLFFFFNHLALFPVFLPLQNSKATAGFQGRASGSFPVEGKMGKPTIKAKSPLTFLKACTSPSSACQALNLP